MIQFHINQEHNKQFMIDQKEQNQPQGQDQSLQKTIISNGLVINNNISIKKPINSHQLCLILGEKNKALMGRILAQVDSTIVLHIINLVQARQKQGAIDSKSSLFIKYIKQYIRSRDPNKIKAIFNKRTHTFHPIKIERVWQQNNQQDAHMHQKVKQKQLQMQILS